MEDSDNATIRRHSSVDDKSNRRKFSNTIPISRHDLTCHDPQTWLPRQLSDHQGCSPIILHVPALGEASQFYSAALQPLGYTAATIERFAGRDNVGECVPPANSHFPPPNAGPAADIISGHTIVIFTKQPMGRIDLILILSPLKQQSKQPEFTHPGSNRHKHKTPHLVFFAEEKEQLWHFQEAALSASAIAYHVLEQDVSIRRDIDCLTTCVRDPWGNKVEVRWMPGQDSENDFEDGYEYLGMDLQPLTPRIRSQRQRRATDGDNPVFHSATTHVSTPSQRPAPLSSPSRIGPHLPTFLGDEARRIATEFAPISGPKKHLTINDSASGSSLKVTAEQTFSEYHPKSRRHSYAAREFHPYSYPGRCQSLPKSHFQHQATRSCEFIRPLGHHEAQDTPQSAPNHGTMPSSSHPSNRYHKSTTESATHSALNSSYSWPSSSQHRSRSCSYPATLPSGDPQSSKQKLDLGIRSRTHSRRHSNPTTSRPLSAFLQNTASVALAAGIGAVFLGPCGALAVALMLYEDEMARMKKEGSKVVKEKKKKKEKEKERCLGMVESCGSESVRG